MDDHGADHVMEITFEPSRILQASKGEPGAAGSKDSADPSDPNSRYFRAELYKTKICRSHEMGLPCAFEEYCCYAHSEQELRTVEQNVADGITKPFHVRQFQKERLNARGGYRSKTAKAQAMKIMQQGMVPMMMAANPQGYVPSPVPMMQQQPMYYPGPMMMQSPTGQPMYMQQPMYVQQPMYYQPQVVYVPVPAETTPPPRKKVLIEDPNVKPAPITEVTAVTKPEKNEE
jgi:hypothetical protein